MNTNYYITYDKVTELWHVLGDNTDYMTKSKKDAEYLADLLNGDIAGAGDM